VFRCYFYPDRINKVPFTPVGYNAAIDNPETWSNFDSCVRAIKFGIGHLPGFALTPEYNLTCIDLDHCINDNGDLSELATKYMKLKDKGAYVERSVSKKGIHIFGWNTGNKNITTHPESGVELYNEKRFIAMTGDIIG
jgi:primase-polymerase (primpol)-like protein